jgi:hypothetical protein
VNATGHPMPIPIPILAGPCNAGTDERPHSWVPGDTADLVSLGSPDHGLSVWLGRCDRCDVPLLAITPLEADDVNGVAWYEARGAEL